jgi:indolepyruvate ferredoxin oxidoreductase
MVGKEDENGERLVPWIGELSPVQLAGIVAARLDHEFPGLNLTPRAEALKSDDSNIISISGATRLPYFCSGCPHNTSTRLPEGSSALAGIGCHFMASWMDRDTEGLLQMGGEGVNWITRSKFNGKRHIFQNLGDGTFYHSGSLAIRQAVAAGTNITFKILYNDAVAMTGGQPVDGPLSVDAIAQSVRAEGIERIAVVSDEPEQFRPANFPAGTTFSHRRDLDTIQRELRDIPGVTVLIYAQTCATEKRRRRKRGTMPDPHKYVVINDLVCEGCGDCSVESNCLSVIPKETPFGRKRQIDQNSCNKDYSCINGFCPSFVTVEGGEPGQGERRSRNRHFDLAKADLTIPEPATINQCFDLLVTGVGGTGVVTVGQLITMAAHLEGKGASVLDFMGFAQKFGPVLSYIRIAKEPVDINQVRIGKTRADAVIGCDLVVSSSPRASMTYGRDRTRALINTAEMATGDFARHRDANLRASDRLMAIGNVIGDDSLMTLDANAIAGGLMGNTIYSNVLLLGAAWQHGLVPVSLEALMRAIELNGVEIERNKEAFTWGRIAADHPEHIEDILHLHHDDEETLDELIERREAFLADYQDNALAARYRRLVDQARGVEENARGDGRLTAAVARSYFKLLSYKDEYEVARLHTGTGFIAGLKKQYGPSAKIRFHFAPPILNLRTDSRGRPMKREFGTWMLPVLRVLARMKRLRGTPFDIFGGTAERRMERALIREFEDRVEQLLGTVDSSNLADVTDIVEQYMDIRGFGPVKDQAVEEVRTRVAHKISNIAGRDTHAPMQAREVA